MHHTTKQLAAGASALALAAFLTLGANAQTATDAVEDAAQATGNAVEQTGDALLRAGDAAGDAVGDAATDAADAVGDAASDAGNAVQDATGNAVEATGEVVEGAGDAVEQAGDAVENATDNVAEGTTTSTTVPLTPAADGTTTPDATTTDTLATDGAATEGTMTETTTTETTGTDAVVVEEAAPEAETMETDAVVVEETAEPVETETTVVETDAGPAEGTPVAGQMFEQSADSFLASTLLGTNVQSIDGDNIGEVDDMVLGADGSVEGVVIGVGGFLGLGKKDVAVEFEAITVQQDPETLEITFVLNSTEEELEAAPEFRTQDEIIAEQQAQQPVVVDPVAPADPNAVGGDAVVVTE